MEDICYFVGLSIKCVILEEVRMVNAYSVVFIRKDEKYPGINRYEPIGVFFESQILSIVEDNLSKLELGHGIEVKRVELVFDPQPSGGTPTNNQKVIK